MDKLMNSSLRANRDLFHKLSELELRCASNGEFEKAQSIHWTRAEIFGASWEAELRAEHTGRNAQIIAFATPGQYQKWARKEFSLPSSDDVELDCFQKFVRDCGFDGIVSIDGINQGDSK